MSNKLVINKPLKLIPDWEKPKAITLIWPQSLPKTDDGTTRADLIDFYYNFINLGFNSVGYRERSETHSNFLSY
jgi:hypothetical protein